MDTSFWIVVMAAVLTAIMTGAGARPFLLVKSLGKRTLGWSNAAAAVHGAGATMALLMLGIITAHSFAGSEGLGAFITTAIAFHDVPEGLAIWMVFPELFPRRWRGSGFWTPTPMPITLLRRRICRKSLARPTASVKR